MSKYPPAPPKAYRYSVIKMAGKADPKPDGFASALAEAFGERYEIVRRLGRGAYGVVYRAVDTMLDRDVAIKQVRLDQLHNPSQVDEIKRRTQREAKMAAKLRHPNIVAIHDIVHTDTSTLLIMEFVDGQTLSSKLRERKRLDLDETTGFVAQIADALDHAHKRGVVHRDIKPANLMIDEKNRIKITDFGIAKSQGNEAASNITAMGNVIGTPHYMSPEQARGEVALDGRSDLFSLGCIVYECLTGNKPFRGKNVVNVLLGIVNGKPDEIDCDTLHLHPDIETVLARALAKDASSRFQTADELVDALRSVRPFRPDDATPRSPVVTKRELGASSSFDAELRGSLSDRGLAEILHDVQTSARTGILHLHRDSLSKRLYFLNGSVVFANSDDESERLGQLLLRDRVIDESSYEQALQSMKKTGRRIGETLVVQGSLDERALEAHINDQVQKIIYSVFGWESGQFGFENIGSPVEEDIARELSTDEIILEGVRSMATEATIRNAIGSLDRIPQHAESSKLDAGKITLTSTEGFVLSRVDGMTSVADLAAISPLGEDETLRCVYGLMASGILELRDCEGMTTEAGHKVEDHRQGPGEPGRDLQDDSSRKEVEATQRSQDGPSRSELS